MSSCLDLSKGTRTSIVWWDMETLLPPTDCQFLAHLLDFHKATDSGLFSLSATVKVRAYGTVPLAIATYKCITDSGLLLQQCISCGAEYGSSRMAMIIDVLLWAMDHTPATTDIIFMSRVFDRSLIDVIHQLHTRSYNIFLVAAFPPTLFKPLRRYDSPSKILSEVFGGVPTDLDHAEDTIPKGEMSRNHVSDNDRLNSVDCAMGSSASRTIGVSGYSHTASQNLHLNVASNQDLVVPKMMASCKVLVHEFLEKGIVEFKVQVLKEDFRRRFGYQLDNKAIGFPEIEKFLQAAIPDRFFTRSFEHGQLVIQCWPSALACNTVRRISQPSQASDTKISMGEVRAWLEELSSSGRASSGVNLSQLGNDFLLQRGKKLDYKSLHHISLKSLLLKFEDLVYLKQRNSIVLLFPRVDGSRKRARTSAQQDVTCSYPLRPQSPLHPLSLLHEPCSVPDCTLLPKDLQASGPSIPRALQAVNFHTRSSIAMSTDMSTSAQPVKVGCLTTSSSTPELPRQRGLTPSPGLNLRTSSSSQLVESEDSRDDACDQVVGAKMPFHLESLNVLQEHDQMKKTIQSMTYLLDEAMEHIGAKRPRNVRFTSGGR